MQIKRLKENIRYSIILSLIAGLALVLADALGLFLFKGRFFNSAAEMGLFLILSSGVAVIFSSGIGIVESLFVSFTEDKTAILAESILTLGWVVFLYAGLEYGTFFHKPRVIVILTIATLSAYPMIRVILRDLRAINKRERVTRRKPKIFIYAVALLVLSWINSCLFFNQNFFLHLIMAFMIFFLAQLILAYIIRSRVSTTGFMAGTSVRVAAVILVCAALFSVFGFNLSQNVKRLSFDQTSIERFMLYTLKRAFDFDGDKYTVLFGGADMDGFNKRVSPEAQEIPDNGIDENGFCGDYKSGDHTLSAIAGTRSVKPAGFGNYNVALIIVDAMRPDHMGSYGYARKTTPFIDELAKDAFIFDHAYAQACHTRTSLPSFMLSQYQPFAGKKWRYHGKTIAELFKEKGYYTVSVIFYKLGDIFVRGYDEFYSPDTPPAGWNRKDPFIPAALEKIDRAKEKKFFLWMHLPYPHHPYSRHPDIDDFGNSNLDRYDNEILYTDRLISDFYEGLSKRGLADKTIFVIMADHGEEFGEHGGEYHNSTAYNEQIHVPLIILIPGRKRGLHIARNVQLIDLNATLLDLSGIEKPGYYLGKSFAGLLDGKKEGWDNRVISGPIGSFQRFAAIEGGWKVIYNMRNNSYELYDLERDQYEQHNLMDIARYRDSRGKDLLGYLHAAIEENNLAKQDRRK
ncbi:MAG: sulfatase [Candidatus Omnitrophota bacterium]